MSSSHVSEKNGVQAGDLGSLLSSSLKISDKPGKKLCDLPVEVLEKICMYLFGGELIEFLTPSFRAPGSRPLFSCHLQPISPDRHAASTKYEAVCLPLASGGDAEFLPWDAATTTNRDIAVANNWAGTRLSPPHAEQIISRDNRITKIDLSAMATCWKLREAAIRMFWSTYTFSFESSIFFSDFIGYHSVHILRLIRHINILFHPTMAMARWWNAAFDGHGKSGSRIFPDLSTLHVTLTPRCDGKDFWATHTKVCLIPVLKFWQANLSHVPITIGRARPRGMGIASYAFDMHKLVLFGLSSMGSFVEDAQWQLRHGLRVEKGQLRDAAFGDEVDWIPSTVSLASVEIPLPSRSRGYGN